MTIMMTPLVSCLVSASAAGTKNCPSVKAAQDDLDEILKKEPPRQGEEAQADTLSHWMSAVNKKAENLADTVFRCRQSLTRQEKVDLFKKAAWAIQRALGTEGDVNVQEEAVKALIDVADKMVMANAPQKNTAAALTSAQYILNALIEQKAKAGTYGTDMSARSTLKLTELKLQILQIKERSLLNTK